MAAWTAEQLRVIGHRGGNLLISAAAGSGKTTVMIERLCHLLTDPDDPVGVDELLVVTFTNQAAAQMRDKLYQRLGRAYEETGDPRLKRQLQLLPAASIMTMHAFCLQCIRGYITRIEGLDPGFRIADEMEAELLKADVLEEVLEEGYTRAAENPRSEEATAFTALVEKYGGVRQDQRLEELILKVNDFLGGIVDEERWLTEMTERYNPDTEPEDADGPWYPMLVETVHLHLKKAEALYDRILRLYEQAGAGEENRSYREILRILRAFPGVLHQNGLPGDCAELLPGGRMDYGLWKTDPEGKKRVQKAVNDAKAAVKEAVSLASRLLTKNSEMVYPALLGLKSLLLRFRARYGEAKRDKDLVDFEDLERFAMRVLIGPDGEETRAAAELKDRYRYICVDEYQDSNDVQEAILNAVARRDADHNPVNVFMVGDVKQSIYRFRQARPGLFLEKQERYPHQQGASLIRLHRNFRSREAVLRGINAFFYALMQSETGEIRYTEEEALVAGKVYPETDTRTLAFLPRLTVLTSEAPLPAEQAVRAEAGYTASRIESLILGGGTILDPETEQYRPVRMRDIVILLRSPQTTAPIFQDALKRLRIPSYCEVTGGFYQTQEIQCMTNFLRVIDNPFQDIPLMGVLYSPVYSFTGHELAELRLEGGKNDTLYHSLLEYREAGKDGRLKKKTADFLAELARFREWAEHLSVSDLLWKLYQETGYYHYASNTPSGSIRRANLDLLLKRAGEYEQGSYSGLFHFLRYIEKMERQSRDDVEASLLGEEDDVVRIMSIHKSKGLEFPVVFLPAMEKRFNQRDQAESLLLHPELGIGAEAIDAEAGFRYETLGHAMIAEKLRIEALNEEMRVLYVAMTRACEVLELVGYRKKEEEAEDLSDAAIFSASCYLDWLLPVISKCEEWESVQLSESEFRIPDAEDTEGQSAQDNTAIDPALYERLSRENEWRYPYLWMGRLPARLSVSELKQSRDEEEVREVPLLKIEEEKASQTSSGAAAGTAIHRALALLTLHEGESEESLREQLARMVFAGLLSEEQRELVPVEQLLLFAGSALAKRILRSPRVLKEQPFILSLSLREIAEFSPEFVLEHPEADPEMRLMIQGMIDCCFIEDGQWVIVDYKSDRYIDDRRRTEYGKQLAIYRRALAQITGVPVREALLYQTRNGYVLTAD